MKNLLILLLACWGVTCVAQTDSLKIPTLPIDSATSLITYRQIIEAPGITQIDLFNKAREWIATNFKSANSVIQMADKDAGKLIGKGNFSRTYIMNVTKSIKQPIIYTTSFTLNISIKDGKYRAVMSDFVITTANNPSTPIEGLYTNLYSGAYKNSTYIPLKSLHNIGIEYLHNVDESAKATLFSLKQSLLSNKKDDF